MPGPYDATLKDLIEGYPADWLAFLTGRTDPVQVIDADLSTVAAATDKVVRVNEAAPWLLHVELQSGPHADLDGRCQWYNTLLGYRHGLPVRSFLVLLQRSADSPRWTGVYRRELPGGTWYLEFRYEVVRLWQVPADRLLAGGLGLLPLAPLGAVAEEQVPDVVRQVQDRLVQEAPPEAVPPLLTAAYVLLGFRVGPEAGAALFERVVVHMKESSTYQLILAEGRVEGEAKGRVEGEAKGRVEGEARGKAAEAGALLLRLGRKRFGEPDAATRSALEAITELDRLEQLSERLLDVGSWQDLLAAD